MSKNLRRAAWAVGIIVAFTLVVAGALVWTQSGRDVLARWVENLASAQIPGRLQIGRLESVGWANPVATEVAVLTPAGERVLYVDRAEVNLGLWALITGTLVFAEGRADGGRVVIEVLPDGTTTVEEALKVVPMPDDRMGIELHNMHFERIGLVLRMSGEDRFVLRDLRGFISVWRRDTPGVRVTMGRVQGVFEKPTITGDTIELRRLDGEVWAQEEHVVSIDLETRIGKGKIDATLDYYDRKENAAVLTLRPERGSGSKLAAAAIEVRSWFSDRMDVTIE